MLNQKTVKTEISISGIGLHTGKLINLTLKPAPSDHGIVLVRIDLPNKPRIPVIISELKCTQLATTIGKGKEAVSTIEHLLSALTAFGIENCICELDGGEIPIVDGSAIPFAFLIKEAGIRNLPVSKKILIIKKEIVYEENGKVASFRPDKKFTLKCSIDFPHPSVGKQEFEFSDFTKYLPDIARARTFGFLKDVEKLKSIGLVLGGSLQNAIVLDDNGVINPEGLRFPDEFVRHKILDAIGDLSLFGRPVIGRFEAHKSGHDMHAKLISAVLSDESNYQILDPSQTMKLMQLSDEGYVFPNYIED